MPACSQAFSAAVSPPRHNDTVALSVKVGVNIGSFKQRSSCSISSITAVVSSQEVRKRESSPKKLAGGQQANVRVVARMRPLNKMEQAKLLHV